LDGVIARVKQQVAAFPGFDAQVKGSFDVLRSGDVAAVAPEFVEGGGIDKIGFGSQVFVVSL